jgi:hypothetical protein
MATTRLELHRKLCDALDSENVYYQPPESVKLKYPCIIYERAKTDVRYANNKVYNATKCYDLTLIYKNADSELFDKILTSFQMIQHDRSFKSDNLYHDVFKLYY